MKTLPLSVMIGAISVIAIVITIFTIYSTHIEILGLKDIYKVNQLIDFKLEAKGYGIPCTAPHILIYKTDQPSILLFEIKYPPYMCPPIATQFFYTMDYPQGNSTYSTTIKKLGIYTIDASFLDQEIKRNFEIK